MTDIVQLVRSLRKARSLLMDTGGFTVNLSGKFPEKGFAVSVDPDHEEKNFVGYPTIGYLVGYVFDHEDILSEDGKYFGGWVDSDGFLFLDVITIVDTQSEALRLAKGHGQLAVYNLERAEEIMV